MKLFAKLKDGNKRTIVFFGIKFKYRVNGTIKIPSVPLRKAFNILNCDNMDIPTKRRLIEQRFMEAGNMYFPDIENARSFNEKIQWLNLYYHNPLITKCTDKCTFKEYLTENNCEEFIVPTIGIYSDANEIDFDSLPEEYVIKSNWGGDSSQVLLIKKGNNLSKDSIKKIANQWLLPMSNLYGYAFNWGYKNIKPKLLIEELLKPKDNIILDYKFLCFGGEPKCAFVVYDRRTNMSLDFFDMDWKKLPFTRKYKNSNKPAQKPVNFEKMKEVARILSKPFPFVRVDFYEINGKLYVGELTFTPGGGFEPFNPVDWDYKLGEWINLPPKMLDSSDLQ